MAAQEVKDTAQFKEEGKPVDLTARVKMKATATAPDHREGEEVEMHPNVARHLANQGFFTYVRLSDEKDDANVSPQVLAEQPGVMTTKGTKKAE